MLSSVDAMRKYLRTYNCFPSYALSEPSADGDPILEIKSCFFACYKENSNAKVKALDFNNYSANNAISASAISVHVDKK
jgi:hypothetical protein